MVVSGQSWNYDFICVDFLQPVWSPSEESNLGGAVRELLSLMDEIKNDMESFRGRVGLRLTNTYGASQILQGGSFYGERLRRADILGTILAGRRDQTDAGYEAIRDEAQKLSGGRVEIATYDRLCQALSGSVGS